MFSYIFKYRWIQPISKLLSLTLTSPDRKTSRLVEQRWEDKNTCTFPLTKKLLGLRKEPQAYIQSRPHKVRYDSMQQKWLLINLYYATQNQLSNNLHFLIYSLHHLLVHRTNNARAGCIYYGKVRRLFDSSRLLNQAGSFLSTYFIMLSALFVYITIHLVCNVFQ